MDMIPFVRFISAIIVFGIMFYFLGMMVTGMIELVTFEGTYASVMLILWGALPADTKDHTANTPGLRSATGHCSSY